MSPSPISASLPLTDSVELRMEQFSRNRQFFGEEAQARIERAFVVVIGVGGVGSHAAHMLARAGVARLRIVDFDNVSLSSLNRHAVATRADVGIPKVLALKRALAAIVPSCAVEAVQAVFNGSRADELLGGDPDLVLDCIDDKDTKLALLDCCFRKRLRVVCSLGAGGRANPTRICIADLAAVRGENLSSALRLVMRRDGLCGFHGIPTGRRRGGAAGKAAAKPAAGADTGSGAAAGADASAGRSSAAPAACSAPAAAAPGADAADSDSDSDDCHDAAGAGSSASSAAPATAALTASSAAAAAARAAGAGRPGPAAKRAQKEQKSSSSSAAPTTEAERSPEELAAIAAERQARKQAARDRAAAARARGFSGLAPASIAAGEAAADPMTGITCVFSSEVPRVNLLPLEMAEGETPSDFGALPGFRVRVIPVLGCIPAMFGQAAAAYALCELAGPEHSLTGRGGAGGATSTLQEGGPLGPAGVVKLLNRFMKREQLLYRATGGSSSAGGSVSGSASGSGGGGASGSGSGSGGGGEMASAFSTTGIGGNPLGHEDVSFLMDDVWRQRSGVSPQRAGHKASFVELCRWRLDRPSVPSNIVAVAEYEADRMHAACEAGFAAAIAELRERVVRHGDEPPAVSASVAVTPGAAAGAGSAAAGSSAAEPEPEPYLTAEQVDALSHWQLLNSPRTLFADILNDGRRPHWLEALLARHHAAAIAAEFGEAAAQFAAGRLAWVRSMGYQ